MEDINEEMEERVPDLMNINEISNITLGIDVDTNVLDPVVNNQDNCRFVLSNRGFLNSFSKITLSVKKSSGATFPVGVGVYALLDSAVLRIGNTELSRFEGLSHWMSYKSMFIGNDTNVERETYTTSRILNHEVIYDNEAGQVSNQVSEGYGLSTKYEYKQNAGGTGGDLSTDPCLRMEDGPVFSVSLADLFPWLRYNQLPLFAINEQVSIELNFNSAASLSRCVHPKNTEASGEIFDIDLTQTKFVADYIFYTDGNIQEKWLQQNPVKKWNYNEYRLNIRTFTGEQLNQKNIIDIGGAGRLCSKVVTSLTQTLSPNDSRLTNVYSAVAPPISNGNNSLFTTNLIYNDNRLYSLDRSNPALHFHDIISTENNVPHITRQEFNNQGPSGGLNNAYTYLEYDQSSLAEGLAGKFHHIAYRLNRNERVNGKGIQLELQYGGFGNADVFTHRSWLELSKEAVLDNGTFRSYYV
jgi:hypothetical protein